MANDMRSLIVTGASGIVGRHFLEAAKDSFRIFAIARRSQKEAGIAEHPNIRWIQVDIGNWLSLRWVMHNIKRMGGADFVLHLAGYYDFDYGDHPEYERTNINGTRYILEQAKILRIKRFVFASSTAACEFPESGEKINERTPVDAEYAYAQAKRRGEEMVGEFSKWFPCSIVRFAAVFTDWCEYGPLYMFLETWLSNRWNARVLGGRGESAVPYIHTHDLNRLLLTLFHNSADLPDLDTYVASPSGCTTHGQMYEIATRFFFGKKRKAFHIPKILALPGVILQDFLGRLVRHRPFIRPWMIRYVDRQLDVDGSYTQEKLRWSITPRYHIRRRLPFLIEKKKSDPYEWTSKNRMALKKIARRPNLILYEALVQRKDRLVDEIRRAILLPERHEEFSYYQAMDRDNLDWEIGVIVQLLASSIRNNDRMLFLDYIRDLTRIRFKEAFPERQISMFMLDMAEIIAASLSTDPELQDLKPLIRDYVPMTIQLAVDEISDVFDQLSDKGPLEEIPDRQIIEQRLRELEAFYSSPESERP